MQTILKLSLIVAMLVYSSIRAMAQNNEETVELEISIIGHNAGQLKPRMPEIPTTIIICLSDHTLFWNPTYIINEVLLKDEEGDTVFIVPIVDMSSTITLPAWLSGIYTLWVSTPSNSYSGELHL